MYQTETSELELGLPIAFNYQVKMILARKVANAAHKTVVTGLVGMAVYGLYTIGNQVIEGRGGTESGDHKVSEGGQQKGGFFNMLRERADEEYKKVDDIKHRDWYDKDDDSYLDKIPKPEDYTPKRR